MYDLAWKSLFLVVSTLLSLANNASCVTSRERYKLLLLGRHENDVIESLNADVITSCGRSCQNHDACVGFNYRAPVCELLSNVSDVNVAQDSADWKLYEG